MKPCIGIQGAFAVLLAFMAAGNVRAEEGAGPAVPGTPEAGRNDYLYLSGEQDSLSPSGSGGGGGVEWAHSVVPGKMSTLLGYSRLNLAGSSVSYLKLGAFWKGESGLVYHADARSGTGSQSGSSFGYRMVKGGITFPVFARLSLDLEDEYTSVDRTRANLVKTTVNYVPLTWLGTVVKYQGTTSGSYQMSFSSGELDLYVESMKIYAGYGSGRYVLNQNIPNTSAFNTQEKFCGIKLPVGAAELDLIWDLIAQPGSRRKTVTLGLKVPINFGQ